MIPGSTNKRHKMFTRIWGGLISTASNEIPFPVYREKHRTGMDVRPTKPHLLS